MAVIDIEKIDGLVAEGDKIFLTPEGETVLEDFLKIKNQVEEAEILIKERLKTKALEVAPDFKSIQSDKIKVFYRAYGSKYFVEGDFGPQLEGQELATTKLTYSLDTKAVEKFASETGGLPQGVGVNDREKQISFSLKDKEAK